MDRQDFWYPTHLRELSVPPTGCRAGQFLFLSTQVPREMETGRVIRRLYDLPKEAIETVRTWGIHGDGREGPVSAQTWQVYTNLGRILEAKAV